MVHRSQGSAAMKLIETTVLETTVRMRYADNADPAKAKEWFAFEVPIAPLSLPSHSGDIALGDHHTRLFASVQLAALRYVRDAIGEETQRLAGLARH
jgi:hypothetical protein